MKKLDASLLDEMAGLLQKDERDEMAIPSYRHKNFFLRWMAWRRVGVLVTHMEKTAVALSKPVTQRTVMDFGCGTGVLFPSVAASFGIIYGVDIVLGAAKYHLQHRTYQPTQIQLFSPEEAYRHVPDHSLDMVIAAEVLEHISPLTDTLDFFWQKLRPDGHLLITVPTENRLYQFGRKLSGFDQHFHVDNAASIHAFIQHDAQFQTQMIKKIPLFAPFDIYWLIHYLPATAVK